MRNFKIILQYDGTRYQGWQKQVSTDNTIQGKLETLLSKMCGAPVEIQGAGRTDSGVHAYGQVANFHTESKKKAYNSRCNWHNNYYDFKLYLGNNKVSDGISKGKVSRHY